MKTAAAYEAYLAHRPAELEDGDVLPRVRLGFAYLANARAVLGDGDEAHADAALHARRPSSSRPSSASSARSRTRRSTPTTACAPRTPASARWDQAVTVCERVVAGSRSRSIRPARCGSTSRPRTSRASRPRRRAPRRPSSRACARPRRAASSCSATRTSTSATGPTRSISTCAPRSCCKPNQARDQVQLSIRLGKTYRRLPAPPAARTRTSRSRSTSCRPAYNANPSSLELAIELGDAYLEAQAGRQGDRAHRQAARRRRAREGAARAARGGARDRRQGAVQPAQAQGGAPALRGRARAASRATSRSSATLVATINEQAFEADRKDAEGRAGAARAGARDRSQLADDAHEPRGARDRSRRLRRRAEAARASSSAMRGSDTVVRAAPARARRTCAARRPDPKKAVEAYAAAETRGEEGERTARARRDLHRVGAADLGHRSRRRRRQARDRRADRRRRIPTIAPAAKRNLALALYRRGWKLMQRRQGRPRPPPTSSARRAIRRVLKGTEPFAFDFSYAVALLDAGRAAEAAKLFKSLAAKGNQGAYLKGAVREGRLAVLRGVRELSQRRPARRASRRARELAQARARPRRDKVKRAGRVVLGDRSPYDSGATGSPGAAQKALATADKYAIGRSEAPARRSTAPRSRSARTSSASSRRSAAIRPSRSSISASSTTCSASRRRRTTRGSARRRSGVQTPRPAEVDRREEEDLWVLERYRRHRCRALVVARRRRAGAAGAAEAHASGSTRRRSSSAPRRRASRTCRASRRRSSRTPGSRPRRSRTRSSPRSRRTTSTSRSSTARATRRTSAGSCSRTRTSAAARRARGRCTRAPATRCRRSRARSSRSSQTGCNDAGFVDNAMLESEVDAGVLRRARRREGSDRRDRRRRVVQDRAGGVRAGRRGEGPHQGVRHRRRAEPGVRRARRQAARRRSPTRSRPRSSATAARARSRAGPSRRASRTRRSPRASARVVKAGMLATPDPVRIDAQGRAVDPTDAARLRVRGRSATTSCGRPASAWSSYRPCVIFSITSGVLKMMPSSVRRNVSNRSSDAV